MTLLYLTLLITTLAMIAVLTLVFFAARLRAHLYHRVFSFFAVLAVAGIMLASVISFTASNNTVISTATTNRTLGK